MSKLYLTMGCPGAGKSTFLKTHHILDNSIIISRDEIRFSIVKPEEEYFSHEDEVLKTFHDSIKEALKNGKNVFADQTSLTPRARYTLVQIGKEYADEINVIWVRAPLYVCLERNENRKGTRGFVPPGTIRDMYHRIVKPTLNEGFSNIYEYDSVLGMMKGGTNDLFKLGFTSGT